MLLNEKFGGSGNIVLWGYPFRLKGANKPIIKKKISKYQKIQNKNSACTF
jgi:hypothetical protein